MKTIPFVLLGLILYLLCTPALAQPNPFLSGDQAAQDKTTTSRQPSHTRWPVIRTLIAKSAAAQRELQRSIADSMTKINGTGGAEHLWFLMGISFVFGVLHAIGPGHRKGILVTYFLGEKTKPLKGIATAFLLAAVHAASAIILVGGFYLFTTQSLLLSVDKAQNLLFPMTYGIILALGIWMIIHGIMDTRLKTDSRKSIGLGGIILSGLVPCPAASAIMILAVAGNAVVIGILSIIMMSLGMGILLATVGLLTILIRDRMTALFGNPSKGKKLEITLQLLSGFAMAIFGLFMVLGSI